MINYVNRSKIWKSLNIVIVLCLNLRVFKCFFVYKLAEYPLQINNAEEILLLGVLLYMYRYMYVYIFVCKSVCVRVMCVATRVCDLQCTYRYMCVSMMLCDLGMFVFNYICVYNCVYVYMCSNVCVCVCLCYVHLCLFAGVFLCDLWIFVWLKLT